MTPDGPAAAGARIGLSDDGERLEVGIIWPRSSAGGDWSALAARVLLVALGGRSVWIFKWGDPIESEWTGHIGPRPVHRFPNPDDAGRTLVEVGVVEPFDGTCAASVIGTSEWWWDHVAFVPGAADARETAIATFLRHRAGTLEPIDELLETSGDGTALVWHHPAARHECGAVALACEEEGFTLVLER